MPTTFLSPSQLPYRTATISNVLLNLPYVLSTDAIDLSTARLALNEVIIWLESKSTVQGSTSASFKSPKKSLKSSSSESVPSASRVSFRDSVYNEETVCALVERTKVAASTVIADRERLLSKQCAKLSELEKQLQESLLRGLIESGTQVQYVHALLLIHILTVNYVYNIYPYNVLIALECGRIYMLACFDQVQCAIEASFSFEQHAPLINLMYSLFSTALYVASQSVRHNYSRAYEHSKRGVVEFSAILRYVMRHTAAK